MDSRDTGTVMTCMISALYLFLLRSTIPVFLLYEMIITNKSKKI